MQGDIIPEEETSAQALTQSINPEIIIRDAQFCWKAPSLDSPPEGQHVRKPFKLYINGEVKFKRGCVNLVTGPTGSGKTSLLMSLLGILLSCKLDESLLKSDS